jgi:hypothetical protein
VKWVIAAVAAAALGAVAGAMWMGHRIAEPTVVADPYEEGLAYDQRHHQHDAAAVGPRQPPRCDLGTAPCAQRVPVGEGGAMATLEVTPRPVRAMRDLDFTLRITPPTAVGARTFALMLEMSGMYMGENVVALSAAGDGVFRGKGVVVRCSAGRRDWSVQLLQTVYGSALAEKVTVPAGKFDLTAAD